MAEVQDLTLTLSSETVIDSPYFNYGAIDLLSGVDHKPQLEFIRTFDLPTGQLFTRADRAALFAVPDSWITLNEEGTVITDVTVPSGTTVELEDGTTYTVPLWWENQTPRPVNNSDNHLLIVTRRTASETKIVTWGSGTRWNWTNHNRQDDQFIHLLQEVIHRLDNETFNVFTGGVVPLIEGPLNMNGFRIFNLGDATSAKDAMNRDSCDARYVPISTRNQAEGWVELEDVGGANPKVPSAYLPDFGATGQIIVVDTAEDPAPDVDDYELGSIWLDPTDGGFDLIYTAVLDPEEDPPTTKVWRQVVLPATSPGLPGTFYLRSVVPNQVTEGGAGFQPGSMWQDTLSTGGNGTGRWFMYMEDGGTNYADDQKTGETGFWVDVGAVDGAGETIARATVAADAPSGPTVGDLWWSSTQTQMFMWDGIEWVST